MCLARICFCAQKVWKLQYDCDKNSRCRSLPVSASGIFLANAFVWRHVPAQMRKDGASKMLAMRYSREEKMRESGGFGKESKTSEPMQAN